MQRIGKYEIKDKVGVGGFGQVFRALDPTMGRMVAIKFLTASDPDILKRFRNEAAAAGKLRHKNIVTVYEYGEQDGVPYIVMELMDGEDLHRVISKHRPLTLLQKVRIMTESADGLHHAHANGVVHRDVKPANIMLCNDGAVKIMDFGIALVTQDTGSRLTPQGSMIGTFRYMAPEQFYGTASDALTDIFSYGIIFYELMAYAHPFQAQEPAAVMRNITQQEPEPLRRVVPECPEALEAIAMRLLSKDREQRYQSLDDVRYDLGAILLGLERERATEILLEARQLAAAEDLTGAQALVRQVLDVDPGHREARELREMLQHQVQRKSVRPRVEALLKTGQEELAAGRHTEALQNFESALKLDRTNVEIREQMEFARAVMERNQAAARLLAEARAAYDRRDFAAARKSALEVMRLDTAKAEVSQLLTAIQDAAERLEREQRMRDAIQKAERFASGYAYDEALAALEALGSDAAEPEVRDLLESIRAKKAESARRQQLQTGLAAAADMLGKRQFEAAVSVLERLSAEFPADQEVAQFLRYGQRELEAERRSKGVEEVTHGVESLVAAKEFAGALARLEEGLKLFPDDGVLVRLKARTLLEKSNWEREAGIQAVVRQCRELESQERFGNALQVAEAAILQYGVEPALQELESRLRQLLDRQRRTETVRKAAAEARQQLKQGLPESAIPPIEEALAKYPADAELTELLGRARQERERAIQAIRSEVFERVQAQDFERAFGIAEQGLRRFPREAVLVEQLDAAKKAQTAWQRQQAIEKVLNEASQLAGKQRFQEALGVLIKSPNADDERVAAARVRIQADWDAHQRRTAVSKAASDARELLKRKQPREAAQLLREVSARYPSERELDELLARADKEFEAQKRAGIIERTTSEVQTLAGRNDYDGALQAVGQGLQQAPGEKTLLALQESIRTQQSAWKRQQAVGEVERQAGQLVQQGKLAEAGQLVGKSLQQFKGEPALVELQKRLEREWEQQKRTEALRAAAAEATALIESGRFEDALQFLADASRRHPGESTLELLRKRAETELGSRRQREQVGRDASALLDAGRAGEAARLLREALARFPGDAALTSALNRAETEVQARQRATGIQKTTNEARALTAQGEFQRALGLLDQGLKTWPGEPSLVEERNATAEAKAAWEREQVLQKRVAEVGKLLQEQQIAQGLKAVDAALREFPGTAALLELQKRLRFRVAVERISGLIDNHRPDQALRALGELRVEYPAELELRALATRAENEQRAQERAAAIEKVVTEARSRTTARDFDGAAAVIDKALNQYPNDSLLTAARQETNAAKSAWQQEEQRRQSRERDLGELRRLAGVARQVSRPAEIEETLHAARKFIGKYPGDADIQAVGNPLVEQFLALQAAGQELAKQNFAGVLTICAKYLPSYPDHAGFLALKTEAAARQRQLEVQDLLRRAAAETNTEGRVRLLSEGFKQYPEEAAIQQELQIARKKLELVNSLRAKADGCEKAGQWDEALEQWSNLAAIERGYPGLDAQMERIRKKREEARSAALAQWVRPIEEAIRAEDLATADRLLAQALVSFPEAAALQEAARRVAEIKQRKARARELLSQGQATCEQGQYADGHRMLREAFDLDKGDAAFRKLVLDALIRYARAALRTDWRIADFLVRDAVTLESGLKVPKDLASSIAEQKQNDAVAARLAKAEQLRASGDIRGALGELQQGLVEYPSEARLKRQKDAIEGELRAWRDRFATELRRLRERAQAATDPVQIDPLIESARTAAAQSTSDSELHASANAAVQELIDRRRQLKSAMLWSGLAARRKQFLYGGVGLVVAVGAFFGVRSFLTPPALVALEVAASPSGATVKVGDHSCTPPCSLQLKPGDYSVEASLDGYKPAVQKVTVDASHHDPVNLSLTPLPLVVQVSTDFSSGRVSLDGKDAGDLKNGQLNLENVPFGVHQLSVTGSEGKAQVKFETAVGHLPTLIGGVSAQNSDAVAISDLGKTANLSSTQANESVTVDGKASGAISSGGLALSNLAEGSRELKIGQRALVMNVRPEPSLTLVVNSGRNVGSLIVETGREDNVTVAVNGKTLGQTSHGILRIPLDVTARPYSVRVEKNGYRVQPGELSVKIQKGEEVKAVFKLEPVQQNATLNISGGMPGARVLVDGAAVGTIASNGTFSTSVKAGEHQIDLMKDGYTPKRTRKNFTPGGNINVARSEAELTVQPPDPRQVEEQDWERIRSSRNASDFEDFLRNHPSGAHAGEARNQATQITQQAQAESARQAEQSAWDAADKTSKAALQEFVSRFGTGPHAQQARGLITGIEAKDADAAAAAAQAARDQQAREQAARDQQKKTKDAERQPPQPQPQPNRTAADQQAIAQTLGAFEAAYNRMDLASLQTLWSGMPKSTADAYRDQFRFAKAVAFHLQPVEPPTVTGDSATVNCSRSLSLTLKSGPRPPGVNERVRVTLSRAGNGWVIRSISAM